jgi:hypothetical protein
MNGRIAATLTLAITAVILSGTIAGRTTSGRRTTSGIGGAAIWAPMTLQELVAQSELIVVGEIGSVREQAGSPYDIASIKVEETLLAPPGMAGLTEARLLLPSRRGPISSDTITYKTGQRGVWFLRRAAARDAASKEAGYFADHPHRFKPVGELADVRAYLKSARR